MSLVNIIVPQMLFDSGFMRHLFLGHQIVMACPLSVPATHTGQHSNHDIKSLEKLVQSPHTKGIADSTRSANSTAHSEQTLESHPYPFQSTGFVSSPLTLLTRDNKPTQFLPTYQSSSTSESPLACKYIQLLALFTLRDQRH